VSCPDWTTLAAHRRERRGVEPDGWPAALEHFDSCPECRREALAADPTLVFRRMPEVKMTPADEAAEAASVRQAVAAMRTASRLEASRRSSAGWRRWAAAAVLAAAALSLGQDGGRIHQEAPVAASSTPVPAGELTPLSGIEGLNRPNARVYQMGVGDFGVTMIYDESLDLDV
jgi:hypothetical protein